jgi:hypothetical protein
MNWFFDLNAKEDDIYFSLCFFRHKFPITSYLDGVIFPRHVTKAAFNMAVNKVKEKCEGATWGIVLKLKN